MTLRSATAPSAPLSAPERELDWLPRIPATIVHREPPPDAPERWRTHSLGGVDRRFAQPVTLTPYAATQPCSARCRFCSENLRMRDAGRAASLLRPGPNYFDDLSRALNALCGLPIGYSLSGLEMTDDSAWFEALAARLRDHARHSPVTETVLYTNGAGLADPGRRDDTLRALAALPSPSIEWSRHHFAADANDRIMRFRPDNLAAEAGAFETALRVAQVAVPVKLVCVAQRGGVESAADVLRYLAWAKTLGVDTVIFRELSQLDDAYVRNATWRYIHEARCPMPGLLADVLAHADFAARFTAERATLGYYFRNLCGRFDGLNVVFEASDYARMNARHRSQRVYKLVLHANGNLCAGWSPDRDVLLASALTPA
jgi:hypothetical protein